MRPPGDRPTIQDDRLLRAVRRPGALPARAPDVLRLKVGAWGTLRAVWRAVGFAFWSALSYSLAILANLIHARSPERRSHLRGVAFQLWSRRLLALFGVHLRVVGAPPSPPFFLVANHLSYLDIVALGASLPCVFVAKGEIDGWPIFGALCRSVGTVFVDRAAKRDIPRALGELEQAVAERRGVVIFGEGTSGSGAEILPFRSSFLDLPARRELPVHWAAISYATPNDDPPAYLSVCWWGEMPFGAHVRELLKVERIEATVVFGEEPVVERDRKTLTARLHAAVSAAFVPVPQPVPLPPAAADGVAADAGEPA